MASSSGREELAVGSQSAHNVYSSFRTRQAIPDPNRVACCYFKAKSGKSTLNATNGQGILLQLPHNESTPLALITSHQLIPSVAHAKQWLIGFDPKKKEFDLEEYLGSSQAKLMTCCGEEHSLWENSCQHSEEKCPMNGDFTILLLGSKMAKEVYDSFGDCLDILSIDDCMNYMELRGVMQQRSIVSVYQRMPASWVVQATLIIPSQAIADTNSLTTHVKMYQNSYSSFYFDTQLKQNMSVLVMGAPVMYTDPDTMRNQLLGMHMYLSSQSAQYGVSLSHIFEILRSSTPGLSLFHPCTYHPWQGHIPILCLLYQSVTGGHCAPNDYTALSNFVDKFGSKLFSPTDLMLILDYLVDKNLLFAQPSSGADDIAMRLASYKVIKSLCKPFAPFSADDISGILATVEMHCPDKSPQQMYKCIRQLCEMVADSMVALVDIKLAKEWFLCWETMLRLKDLVVSVLCDPHSHYLHIITTCQEFHMDNPIIQHCFASIMKECAYARLQTIFLLEEEKDSLKMQHAKDISVLEKRLRESELEKVKAQERVKVLSEQNDSQTLTMLVEEGKKNARLEDKLEQVEKEKNELQKQLQEHQNMLRSLSFSDQWINQTAKKHANNSSIVFDAEAGMRKLYGDKRGDFPDFSEGGSGSNSSIKALKAQPQPVTPNERVKPNLRRQSSSPSDMGHYSYSPDSSLEGRNRFSFSSSASSESMLDLDVERDSHPPGIRERTHSWTPSSSPTQAQPEKITRRSFSIPVPIPEDYGTVTDPERDKRLKDIVTQNLNDFLQYSNFDNLGPILLREKLVNEDELKKLTDSQTTARDRARHFYSSVLPTKGSDAYSLFRKCLEEEEEHRGHKDLLHKLA